MQWVVKNAEIANFGHHQRLVKDHRQILMINIHFAAVTLQF